MNIQALSSNAPLSKPNFYKFNGNEEQDDFDLGLYDFNARFYDPVLGRFASVDPLSDDPTQFNQSPYQFSWNNPVTLNDPSGECPKCPKWLNKIIDSFSGGNDGSQQSAQELGQAMDESSALSRGYRKAKQQIKDALSWIPFGAVLTNVADAGMADNTSEMFSELGEAGIEAGIELSPFKMFDKVSDILKRSDEGAEKLVELGIEDGMEATSSSILDMAQEFLGKGYREAGEKGSGRFVSEDGTRVFRMGTNDITGKHGGGPHVNFEILVPNPNKPDKMMRRENIHVYIKD